MATNNKKSAAWSDNPRWRANRTSVS